MAQHGSLPPQESLNSEPRSKQGKFVVKDGKLVSGEAEKRKEVDYSNWYAGNTDPEDLKK